MRRLFSLATIGIINGEVANLIDKHNLGWIASPDHISEIADIFQEIILSKPEILIGKKQNTNTLLEDQFNRKKIIQKFTNLVFN